MFSERVQTSEQTVGEECGVRAMDQILSPCWPRWAHVGALFGGDERERLRLPGLPAAVVSLSETKLAGLRSGGWCRETQ